nr:thiamine phosphate synthase [Companilactobacillus baiquanensis]
MTMKFNSEMLKAYFVCGSQDLDGQDFEKLLEKSIESGITAFQFRDKGSSTLTSQERLELGERLRDICRSEKVPFIVDDDVELANKLSADGIHVGQKDEQIKKVIAETSPDMMIGLSAQTLDQIKIANKIKRIDYIGAGPIFPTTSKPDAVDPMGLSLLNDMSHASKVPIVAIGGILKSNLRSLRDNGAVGAAFITLITQSDDIEASVKDVLNVFD